MTFFWKFLFFLPIMAIIDLALPARIFRLMCPSLCITRVRQHYCVNKYFTYSGMATSNYIPQASYSHKMSSINTRRHTSVQRGGSLVIGYHDVISLEKRSVAVPSGTVHVFTGVSIRGWETWLQPNSAPYPEGWLKASLRLIKGSAKAVS